MFKISLLIQHPTGYAHSFFLRRQHFVLDHIASETHQSAGNGKHIFRIILEIHSELTAEVISPIFIQVTDHGKFAMITGFKLIEVSLVVGAGRIHGGMKFHVLKTQEQRPVDKLHHLVEAVDVQLKWRCCRSLIDPPDVIAPYRLVDAEVGLLTDAGFSHV